MIDIAQLSDLEILTLTLIGESRGESIEGIVAVGCVIRNRVNTYKKSYSEVCLAPKQFSCWNLNDPNRVLLLELADDLILSGLKQPSYIQCQYVAIGIYNHFITDNTHGALNYITLDLWNSTNRPSWAKDVNFAISKGSQIFFTPREKHDTSIA